jgi:hypothetical protein
MELEIIDTVNNPWPARGAMRQCSTYPYVRHVLTKSNLVPFTAGNAGDNFPDFGWTRSALSETFMARRRNSRTA